MSTLPACCACCALQLLLITSSRRIMGDLVNSAWVTGELRCATSPWSQCLVMHANATPGLSAAWDTCLSRGCMRYSAAHSHHPSCPFSVAAAMTGIILFLLGMNGYLAVSFSSDKLPSAAWAQALFWLGAAVYVALIVYLCITPQQ